LGCGGYEKERRDARRMRSTRVSYTTIRNRDPSYLHPGFGYGFRVLGFGSRAQGFGFRKSGFGPSCLLPGMRFRFRVLG